MNKPLRRLSIAVLVMFGLLLLNANYLQVVRAESLHNNSNNPRLILEEYSRQRGPIVVGGKQIARSVETNNRLKYKRTYAQGKLYAPATGFYSLVYGASGIEAAENSILSGTDDSLFVRRVIDLLTREPPQGGSVSLTLNARAQKAAYDGLNGRKGAVAAIDPSTGAILALVSSPSYDPNLLASHDAAAVRRSYKRLSENPNKPMLNRALRETYTPGSTFKVVTAAAALENGMTKDTKVFNGPQLDLPQTTSNLPNENGRPCNPGGEATLQDALAFSCNASFGKVGLDLGAAALAAQARKFGFGEAFTIPMRSAVSRFPQNLNPPQTAQSAIGQFSVQATPLQMAMVAAATANTGRVMSPYLVQELRAPDLSPLDITKPKELGQAMSPQSAQQLTDMMVNVVENGTGTNGQIPGIRVAGKTGTAQQGGGRRPHAWFISFAPAENPKVAVAVVIENGGEAAEISGNQLAAPIARDVMRAVLGR
ncbi:MAG: penicillin-binding protein [Actinomycetota bacterium]|nr:penicillin-binding protein [Actinomycetota bacterium]